MKFKEPQFSLTRLKKDDTGHYGDCLARQVPYIHIAGAGKLVQIEWDVLGLCVCSDPVSHKLTEVGIQLQQLGERCQLPKSEHAVHGAYGYFKRVRREHAVKVAKELWEIFSSAMNEKKLA
jgi:hypothetical protein